MRMLVLALMFDVLMMSLDENVEDYASMYGDLVVYAPLINRHLRKVSRDFEPFYDKNSNWAPFFITQLKSVKAGHERCIDLV